MKTILTALFLIAITASVGAMYLTPSEEATAILAPTIAEIANMKLELIAGNVTLDEYMSYMQAKKTELELKTLILEAIRDSDRPYGNKIQAVYTLFSYKPIRHSESEVEVITYK
jgi:hypothetical protein